MPAWVSGQVRGGAAGIVLAIVVDGRVRVSTRVDPDRGQFTALLPVAALRPGAHTVDVLEVLPGDALRRLGGT